MMCSAVICAKFTDSDLSHTCVETHPGICSPLIHTILSNDSVNEE